MRGLGRNSMTGKVFAEIVDAVGGGIELMFVPQAMKFGGLDGYETMLYRKKRKEQAEDRRRKWQALQRLRRQKYIRVRQEGDRIIVALTEKGRDTGLKWRMKTIDRKLSDGQRVYVVFDIPESVKYLRETLRRVLKESHFSMLQLSVWSTDRDVAEDVTIFVKSLQAEKWVHVFIGKPMTSLQEATKKLGSNTARSRSK